MSGLNRIELAIIFCPPTHPTSHLQEPCRNLLDGGECVFPLLHLQEFFTCRITCGSPLVFLEQHLLDVCMLKLTVCSPCFTEKGKVHA